MSAPRRWWNPNLPQTLQTAVFLLYLNAVFGVIGGGVSLILVGLMVAGGFGIANERKWGYRLAAGVAILRVAVIVLLVHLTGLVKFVNLVPFMFAVALVAVIVHPMSREHQRIWFH